VKRRQKGHSKSEYSISTNGAVLAPFVGAPANDTVFPSSFAVGGGGSGLILGQMTTAAAVIMANEATTSMVEMMADLELI
jgi:hypothetical protein